VIHTREIEAHPQRRGRCDDAAAVEDDELAVGEQLDVLAIVRRLEALGVVERRETDALQRLELGRVLGPRAGDDQTGRQRAGVRQRRRLYSAPMNGYL
jgi:hypothetical protein